MRIQPESSSTPESAAEALALLERAGRLLIVGHQSPDGDCLGSKAALAALLRARGQHVELRVPDAPDPRYDFLCEAAGVEVHVPGELPEHDLCVLVDASRLERCAELGAELERHPSRKLVIDHHIHAGPAWWDGAYVDTSASATGLLIHRLSRHMNVSPADLDPSFGLGVFVALVTDTGWFRYSNTDAETLSVAAELIDAGLSPARIDGLLHQRQPAGRPKAIARVLAGTRTFGGGRLAVATSALGGAHDVLEESDEVLDLLRAVEAVEVVLFLREVEPRTWKLSARSKGDFDVQALAQGFGGGGHRRAAGATLHGEEEALVQRLVAAVEKKLLKKVSG